MLRSTLRNTTLKTTALTTTTKTTINNNNAIRSFYNHSSISRIITKPAITIKRRTSCCYYHLKPMNNIIKITTSKYNNVNMMIQKNDLSTTSSTSLSSSQIIDSATTSSSLIPAPASSLPSNNNEDKEDGIKLIVSIVGPPNAGKSTLFNRLMCKQSNKSYKLNSEKNKHGKRKTKSNALSGKISTSKKTRLKIEKNGIGGAIISNIPGTTRDKRECIGRIDNVEFTLYDTAGLDCERFDTIVQSKNIKNELKREMTLQTLNATKESDLIFILFDARIGVTNDLIEIGKWFRKQILSSSNNTINDINSSNDGGSISMAPPPMHKMILLGNKLEGSTWASYPTITKVYNNQTDTIEYKPMDNSNDNKSITILDNLNDASNALGFGINAIPISALQGDGISDLATIIHQMTLEKRKLHEELLDKHHVTNDISSSVLPTTSPTIKDNNNNKPLQLAILGRQNVGKSTLVNTILNSKRVLVGPMPGLTRDAISINYLWENIHPVKIVDTAGIRKVSKRDTTSSGSTLSLPSNMNMDGGNSGRNRAGSASTSDNDVIHDDIEDQAVYDAIRAMKTADVAAIVLDAQARYITKQELAIADAVIKEGRALVIVANKMDLLVENDYTKEDYANDVQRQLGIRFPFLRNTPVIPVCSLNGDNVNTFMPIVFNARYRWERKISTSLLNSWLKTVLLYHPPPSASKPIKIKYIIQTKGRPPTFLLFCNHTNIPKSYLKYLTKNFQDTFEMFGMEVRLSLKISTKVNPFDDKNTNTPNTTKSNIVRRRRLSKHGVGGRDNKLKRKIDEYKKHGKTLKGFEKRKEYYR